MIVVFYTVIVYIWVFMTYSTYYCLCEKLMDQWNVRMYGRMCVYIYIYICVCVCVCVCECFYVCMYLFIMRFPYYCGSAGWQVLNDIRNSILQVNVNIHSTWRYGYMYCIVTWYVLMFCVVAMVYIHVLYCDSGTCTCFLLWVCATYTGSVLSQWCTYLFCIVTVVHIHVLYCDSGMCTCFVLL